MRFPILRHFRSAPGRKVDPAVSRDADELIQLWGHVAFARASEMSWREDTGLVASSRPGHWWRVRREIGHRIGQTDVELDAEVAA